MHAGQRRERSDEGDVTVVRVEEGGQAEKLGVEVGMVLVGVAGVPVINAATGLPRLPQLSLNLSVCEGVRLPRRAVHGLRVPRVRCGGPVRRRHD